MGFIKNALIGIALYEAVKYLTRQDEFGKTKFDELKEQAPEWIDKAKAIKEEFQQGLLPEDL